MFNQLSRLNMGKIKLLLSLYNIENIWLIVLFQ